MLFFQNLEECFLTNLITKHKCKLSFKTELPKGIAIFTG